MVGRRRLLVLGAGVGLLLVAIVVVVLLGTRRDGSGGGGRLPVADRSTPAPTLTAGAVPPEVTATVSALAARDLDAVRSHLQPDLAAALSQADLLPAGSTLVPVEGSWIVDGDNGDLLADLSVPGTAARQIELTFLKQGQQWLLVLADPA